MLVKELIEKLQALPKDKQVCIFDWKDNVRYDYGEGSAVGIYSKFNVSLMGKDDIPENSQEWVALEFTNENIEEEEG